MAHPALIEHNKQFPKGVIMLAPGVWSAVGFAASNVHMVEGAESVTIIDTSESTSAAENIRAAFAAHCDKPIGRIIYTHSHRDHISGARVFSQGGDVPIWASATFKSDLIGVDEGMIAPNKALGRRTQAQFGIGLNSEERVSLGCGPGDRPMQGLGAGFIAPTQRVATDQALDLDGVRAELILAPGETEDHMMVWLPEVGVLFGGDNWYHAFPNLYAIRGTAYRDFAAWAATLGQMAALGADVLAPGHTLPVAGKEKVREVLGTTRAAIEHVMQFTSDAMDRGLSMDDIAATITLPEALADKPWLGEFYGKISWSARAFAAGTLGWYDGNPTNLGTLSSKARALHVAALAGGVDALVAAAGLTGDLQWKLEICDHLLSLGHPAEQMKAEALVALAEDEINATARNTYLWEAKRLMAEGTS
ncbi:alkyl/aryl-sulfatase [Shimia abyssi]|uniref:Putative sulfatase n=1 Tax=Shimia abyssi TaxID=1662395 RepID=A0A2P8FJV3_9RHOB|nr:alkyl/aryl-sulfatase [Shimia abyssi]PSL21990.1 putative sulfatase [Shimia abyssi]